MYGSVCDVPLQTKLHARTHTRTHTHKSLKFYSFHIYCHIKFQEKSLHITLITTTSEVHTAIMLVLLMVQNYCAQKWKLM
jgi:hypothetical protein